MKILVIMPTYYPAFNYGGPIQSVHLLNTELVKLGIEVVVITSDLGVDKKTFILQSDNTANIDGVKVKYIPVLRFNKYVISLPFILAILKEIKDSDIIYLISFWDFPVFIGSILSQIYNKPYIISPRGSIYRETINMKSTLIKQFYLFLVGKKMLTNASKVHFTTTDERDKIISYLNINIDSIVIPNGVDLQRNDVSIQKCFLTDLINKKYLLFVGRITKKKGLDLLLHAFKKLVSEFKELLLVIVGPDNEGYKKELQSLIKDLDLEGRVIFTGLLLNEDKVYVYKNAEFLILPSYSENFGMVVIEAMSYGTPVIISNQVGISSEIKENSAGVVVEVNIDDIYNNLKNLLLDDSLRAKLSIVGKNYVFKNYSINNIASKFKAECFQLINKT